MKSASDNCLGHIAAEVRKIGVNHSAGETVLHKAARLGYLVTCSVTFYKYCASENSCCGFTLHTREVAKQSIVSSSVHPSVCV